MNLSDNVQRRDDEPGSHEPGDTLPNPLRRLAQLLRKRLWVVLAVITVGVTAAVLWTIRQPKIYEAVATVVVDPQAPKAYGSKTDDAIEIGTSSYWSNQEYYNTQVAIIASFPIAKVTVQSPAGPQGSYVDRLLPARPGQAAGADDQRVEQAADAFTGMLSASWHRDSRLISIRVRSTDPALAVALANTHVQSYMAATRGLRTNGTEKVSQYLAVELDDSARKLRAAETNLMEFKTKNNLTAGSIDGQQALLEDQIKAAAGAVSDAQIERDKLASVSERAATFHDEDVLESPIFALASNSEVVDEFKKQYSIARRDLTEVEKTYGPKMEQYQSAQKKVDQLMAEIQREAKRASREIAERFQVATRELAKSQSRLATVKAQATTLSQLKFEYDPLERDQEYHSEQYKKNLESLGSSKQEGRNDLINVKEHELARGAYLVSPKMKVNVVVAFILSMMLGVALAYLIEARDRRIKTPDELERAVRAPLLGIIPIVAEAPAGDAAPALNERDLFVFRNPTSRVAECCRSIRTNILFSAADRPMKLLTVSSARPREGKTTTTIYMGTTMAQSGQRVLLIDTDLRRPRLHKSLAVPKNRGLTNLLLGDADYDDVIKSTDIPNLFVLPCGPLPPNPAELLLTKRFKQILEELARRYDRILLDSPPVLAVTDAVVLARISDGVILVAQAGKILSDDITQSAKQFRDANATVLGVILNDMDVSDRRYGSYYYAYGGYGEAVGGKAS